MPADSPPTTALPASYAAGVRLPYHDLPDAVTDWIAEQVSAPIVEVADRQGGFSPGTAATVRFADGSGLFVKAVTDRINPDSLELFRHERDRGVRLPRLPGVLKPSGSTELAVDDDHWLVITFPLLDGEPPRHPWSVADTIACLDLADDLGRALTPSPWPTIETQTQKMINFLTGWQRLADEPTDPWRDDPWIRDHLNTEVAAEQQLALALPGDTLSHSDLRADNIMINNGRPWFVDWAHARNLAQWFDPMLLMADVISSGADVDDGGTVDIAGLLRTHPAFRSVSSDLQLTFLSSYAVTQHLGSTQPAPAGLPTLRGWQDTIATTILGYVRRHR